jgi:hypothetical protein
VKCVLSALNLCVVILCNAYDFGKEYLKNGYAWVELSIKQHTPVLLSSSSVGLAVGEHFHGYSVVFGDDGGQRGY